MDIEALESLRALTGQERETFYKVLLLTPLGSRPGYVRQLIDELPEEIGSRSRIDFMLAHARLRT